MIQRAGSQLTHEIRGEGTMIIPVIIVKFFVLIFVLIF